jgi:transposase
LRRHSAGFKARRVERMSAPGPERISASRLSNEVGIGQPTHSRRLRAAGKVRGMKEADETPVPKPARRRPQEWTPAEKLKAVQEAGELTGEALGAYLRRAGLHEAQLVEWRAAALSGLSERDRAAPRVPESRRIRTLEQELRRKQKALAETAALWVLRGEMEAFSGVEGDGTKPRRDK